MNKTVLITSVGAVAGEAIVTHLHKQGYRVVATNIYPEEWLPINGKVERFYQICPTEDETIFFQCVERICLKEQVSYIIPLTDVDVDFFDKKRDWATRQGIILCISGHEPIALIRNKKSLQDWLGQKNRRIKSIPSVYIDEEIDPSWEYPLVCKPVNGRSSQGLFFLRDKKEIELFRRRNEKNRLIIEPFIAGDIIVVDIVSQPEYNAYAVVSRTERIRTPHGLGMTVDIFDDKMLSMECIEIAKDLGIQGCVNFELIRTESGDNYFMECNPRFSAGVEFSCMAGYDCISNHMRCFSSDKIEENPIREVTIVRSYKTIITGGNT